MGSYRAFTAVVTGLVVGLIISSLTERYTSSDYKAIKKIATESETGDSTNIINGLSAGMMSTVGPIVVVGIAILASYYLGGGSRNSVEGLYSVALAAVGMLSTTGITIAIDAYGPIADNAGGIAEMCELPGEVREITDKLDAVGNTTAAVGKAAFKMIEEVRIQFREMPGIMEGITTPDYAKCVDISTKVALKEMIIPGLATVVVPIVVGVLLGAEALGGLISGSLITGVLMAIFMSNAGGAWDNAKKYIEEGNHGGKGSEAHKAAVIGDTVGDPFKDTSGPSLNNLIKLITTVALLFAEIFGTGILS